MKRVIHEAADARIQIAGGRVVQEQQAAA